jgi:very-short-patch-repair endonuclease
METMLLRVLRQHGFAEPETQYVILDVAGGFVAQVDAAYPQWKIAIEYDSDEHHAGKLAHRRDSNRRLKIAAVGFEALTVTHDELDSGGRNLVAAVRTAKTRRLAS